MARLTDPEIKLFIVHHLATWHTPRQVQTLLQEQYGLSVTPQQISAYNPETVAGARLSADLKAEFYRARQEYVAAASAERAKLPLTLAHYRLRKLQELLDHPTLGKSPKVVLDVIRLIEQIEGGVFQRHQETGDPEGLKLLRDFLTREGEFGTAGAGGADTETTNEEEPAPDGQPESA